MAPECDPTRKIQETTATSGVDDDSEMIDQAMHTAIMTEEVIAMCCAAKYTMEQIDNLIRKYEQLARQETNDATSMAALEAFFAMPAVKVHCEHVANTVAACERLVHNVTETMDGIKLQPEQNKATFAQALNQPSTSQGSSSAQEEPSVVQSHKKPPRYTATAGMFAINMRALTNEITTPIELVQEAIGKKRIHVAKMETKGHDVKVRFFKRKDMELAMELIRKHKTLDKELDQLYEITAEVKSSHSVRSSAVPGSVISKIPFIKEGRVDQKEAARLLFLKNPTWFRSISDVEYVEMHEVPRMNGSKYILEVHITSDAHNRLDRINGERTLDVTSTQLVLHTATRQAECFKCLQTGHVQRNCKAETPSCKYCPGNHLSITCAIKTDEKQHTCRTCLKANEKAPPSAHKLNVNHIATSTKCRFIRNKVQQAQLKHTRRTSK